VALVTGGGRGLGEVMARRLAESGAAVALVARSADDLARVGGQLRAGGARVAELQADVADAAALDVAFEAAERALGPLTLVVNGAGDGAVPGPLWQADPARWWRTFEVNLQGVFHGMHAALRRMVPRGHGRVVNVSSRAGNTAIAHASAYATSKAAVTRLTEIAALEAAPHGVQVFALEPGTVRTPMTETLLASEAGRRWIPWYQAIFDEGRDVSPEEGAALLLRIARGDADRLSGRFVSRADDLDTLVADAERVVGEERLVLRLTR
jgi:NAD(P)-dependent dehydrogenase (short-subunit alcohol dehydrogenase family)